VEKYKANMDLEVIREYMSYNIDKEDDIVKLAKKAADAIGVELKMVVSGGGSDTNILNEKGNKTINLGIGMENVHSKDERIKIDNLNKGVEFLESIIKNVQ
jgi:tripeptide aminopeptidase